MTNLTETAATIAQDASEGLLTGLLASLPTSLELVEAVALLSTAALVTFGINFLL